MMSSTLPDPQLIALSIGPVLVHKKGEYALDLLGRLQLEVLARQHELNKHLNNALIREACPVLMPVAALMLMILTHPGEASPVEECEGEIVTVNVPRHFEPLTIGDLCVIIGAVHVQRRKIRVEV